MADETTLTTIGEKRFMNLQELHQHFPSLRGENLDQNYFMLNLANEYGVDEVKLAIAQLCILGNRCDECEKKDNCPQKTQATASLVLGNG